MRYTLYRYLKILVCKNKNNKKTQEKVKSKKKKTKQTIKQINNTPKHSKIKRFPYEKKSNVKSIDWGGIFT